MNKGKYHYEVSMYVELTVEEATFLKYIAGCHYDARVREEAVGGCINGLLNSAMWRAEDLALKAPHGNYIRVIQPRDADTILKALEQWSVPSPNWSKERAGQLATMLTEEFNQLMTLCYARKAELQK